MKNSNKRWLPRLFIIVLILIMGFVAYLTYYNAQTPKNPGERLSWPVLSAVYSTLKLFTMGYSESTSAEPWVIVLLDIARFAAILITGTALGKLLIPLLSTPKSIHRLRKWKKSKKKVLLIGNNEENLKIAQGLENNEKNDKQFIISDNTNCEGNKHVLAEAPDKLIPLMIEAVFQSPQAECYIIINTKDEEKNLCLCHDAVQVFRNCLSKYGCTCDPNENDYRKKEQFVSLLNRLKIIVVANIEQESIYLDLRRIAYGSLQFCNKARNMALDYVLEHPLTEQLAGEDDLQNDATLKPETQINVFLIGFGHVNQQIYSVMAATNQFITGQEGQIPEPAPVHYYAYDPKPASAMASLDSTCFRYKRIFSGKEPPQEYLPLPEQPADFTYVESEIGSAGFFDSIFDRMNDNAHSVNTVIIAAGNDLMNLDLAQQFALRKHEAGLKTLQIHCRVQNRNMKDAYDKLDRNDGIQILDIDNINMDFDRIVEDSLSQFARKRNMAYFRMMNPSLKPEMLRVESLYQWYLMNPHKQDSNLFDALSMRFKLNLLGLDFCRDDQLPAGMKAINEEEYWRIYANSKPRMSTDIQEIETLEDFTKGNPRQNLAVEEHYRWNAYMISQGFIPADKARIAGGDTKNYDLRYHGNLTTFEGLFEYRKLRMESTGATEYDADVVKYDYQIMDEAWRVLHEAGYTVYVKHAFAEA